MFHGALFNNEKVVLFVLFLVIANPMTYKLVNDILSTVGVRGMIFGSGPGVSQTGVVIHAAVFVLAWCALTKLTEGFVEGMSDDCDNVDCEEEPENEECCQ